MDKLNVLKMKGQLQAFFATNAGNNERINIESSLGTQKNIDR